MRVETEGERGSAAEGEDGAEEVQLLGRHLGEAVEPEAGDERWTMDDGRRRSAKKRRGHIKQLVAVLDLTLLQPLVIGAQQVVEVVEFVAERGTLGAALGEAGEARGRKLVALELAEELAELAGETGQARGGAEDAERGLLAGQQRAQHHHAALVIEQFRDGAKGFEQPAREAVEGDDLQTRITGEVRAFQNLALQLKRRLLGCEEQERRAVGSALQLGADFLQATPSLAAAGRAEEEVDAHAAMVGGSAQSSRFKVL